MHATLLVAIRDAEDAIEAHNKLDEMLERFDENAEMPERVEWVDGAQLQECVATFADDEDKEWGPGPLSSVPQGDLDGFNEWRRKCVGAWMGSGVESGVFQDGKFGYRTSYNPDGRWDWWVLGGRWHGFWMLRTGVERGGIAPPDWKTKVDEGRVQATAGMTVLEGQQAILGMGGTFDDDPDENFAGRADLARKRDIDFEQMRVIAAQSADLMYDKYEAATKGIDPGPSFNELIELHKSEFDIPANLTYRDSFNRHDPDMRAKWTALTAKVRQERAASPWLKALTEAGLVGLFTDAHAHWLGGREAFIERARLGVVSTHATLVDGVWRESDWLDDDRAVWNRQINTTIDNLPDDCFLAVVDYHS